MCESENACATIGWVDRCDLQKGASYGEEINLLTNIIMFDSVGKQKISKSKTKKVRLY